MHVAEHRQFLDGYFFVFFWLAVLGIWVTSVSSFIAIAKIEKRTGGTDWRKWARKPSDHELRVTSYGWLVPVRRITVIVAVATIAYGLLSPTLRKPIGFLQPDPSCENVPAGR